MSDMQNKDIRPSRGDDRDNIDGNIGGDSAKLPLEKGAKFSYTYKALSDSERRMVESIRGNYEQGGNEQSKLARLQELDKKAKTLPKVISITIGVIGLMLFGLGMSMALEWKVIGYGAVVCVLGAAVMVAAYPINQLLFKLSKRKWGDEILSLTSELLDEQTTKKQK